MKYSERRVLYPHSLNNLCIEKGWYTKGNNYDYEKLFSKLPEKQGQRYTNITTEMLVDIAEDISLHSDCATIDILFELGRRCITFFEVEEDD